MTAHLCLAAWSVTLLAGPAPPTPGKSLPPVPGKGLPAVSGAESLTLWIGGLSMPNYSATLAGDALIYRVRSIDAATGRIVESSRVVRPSPERWRGFWRSMDELDLWRWRANYEDARIFDGTAWGVEAAHDGRLIRSRGRGLAPGRETLAAFEKAPDGHGPTFDKYLAAVETLLGGLPFR